MKFHNKLLLVTLILLVGIFVNIEWRRMTSPYMGEKAVVALSSDVEVLWDINGIPHIYAQNAQDLYRAFGAVMAQQRLFQMDLMRRLSTGRLSELFGRRALSVDILSHSLRYRKSMEEILKTRIYEMPKEMIQAMDAFILGVNEYIAKGDRPLEYLLLGEKPQKFDRLDIFSLAGHMAFSFGQGMRLDLLYSQLFDLMPEKGQLIRDLGQFSKDPSVQTGLKLRPDQNIFEAIDQYFPRFVGSNSFVLSGNKTTTGLPILANDPHIRYSQPGVWFEAHLNYPGYEAYGKFLPLLPFPIVGHTRDYAWGMTISGVDDMDFYQERFHSKYKNLVRDSGNFVQVQKDEVKIKVKGEADYTFDLLITPRGPVLNEFFNFTSEQKKYIKPKQNNISVHWAFHHPENYIIETAFHLSRLKGVEELRPTLSLGKAPGLNVTYADTKGNIAWGMLGHFQLKQGNDAHKLIQSAEKLTVWPPKELAKDRIPYVQNPKNGFIVSANINPNHLLEDQSVDIPGYWESMDRQLRLEGLIAKQEKWSPDQLKSLMTDNVIHSARKNVQILLQFIDQSLFYKANHKFVLNKLKQWNGETLASSSEASVYHIWMTLLNQKVLEQHLSAEQIKVFCSTSHYGIFVDRILADQQSLWWSGQQGQFILESYLQTIKQLEQSYGGNFSSWKWGRLHQLEFKHPLGKNLFAKWLFNLGPYAIDGSYKSVNNQKYKRCEKRYDVVAGPSTRILISLDNPSHSWGILPSGNSGRVGDRFYSDQIKKFLSGQMRPQYMNRKEIEQNLSHRLILKANTH